MKPCVFIGASWKMNKTLPEALEFCQFLSENMPKLTERIQTFIIPPFTCLREVRAFLEDRKVRCLIGAQNMHYEENGDFTGEISPNMLKDAGASMVQLGSYERRLMFSETDSLIHKKVLSALNHDIQPMICVGDTIEDRECNSSIEVVLRQVKIATSGLTTEQLSRIIIIYQPIWASGSSTKAATPGQIEKILSKLRVFLISLCGPEIGINIPLLYSGNVNEQNASAIIVQPNVDGLMIGHSGLKAEIFCNIISQTSTIFR